MEDRWAGGQRELLPLQLRNCQPRPRQFHPCDQQISVTQVCSTGVVQWTCPFYFLPFSVLQEKVHFFIHRQSSILFINQSRNPVIKTTVVWSRATANFSPEFWEKSEECRCLKCVLLTETKCRGEACYIKLFKSAAASHLVMPNRRKRDIKHSSSFPSDDKTVQLTQLSTISSTNWEEDGSVSMPITLLL
jgi:hypothetical protein